MTTQKTLKRRVRARSAKTGESYTAARAQLLRKADPPGPPRTAMALAGMTDEAMTRGSGKPLSEWSRSSTRGAPPITSTPRSLDGWSRARHRAAGGRNR